MLKTRWVVKKCNVSFWTALNWSKCIRMVTWYIWLSIYTNNETLCIIWNFYLSSRGVLGRIYALNIEVLSVTDFSASVRAKVFKFLIHLDSGQVYCGKENQDAEINMAFFFHFSISHSIVIHREICVKGFSGTTTPRILKFGKNVGYDLLYCVRENQPPNAYHFLYLSIFLSLQASFLLQVS